MGLFKKKEAKKEVAKDISVEEYEKTDELKMAGLEAVLGTTHELVGHAIIPYMVGGTVDMYYFPNHIKGTGFATMELIKPDGTGSIPNRMGTYELVAFTKHVYNPPSKDTITPFNRIERRLCGIFTSIGGYSTQAKLEPLETCELPQGEETICLVLDEYKPGGKEFKIGDKTHGLLLILEVHRDEMEYAMAQGGEKLIEKLKEKGHYPYSDLDRESVLK